MVVKHALQDWLEYKKANQQEPQEKQVEELNDPNRGCNLSELQSQHALKIYTNVAVDPRKKKNGFGLVVKTISGALVATWAIPVTEKGDLAVMEACAIREAMLKALEENWTSILFVSDYKVLVQKINISCDEISDIGLIVNGIRTLSRSFQRRVIKGRTR